MSEAKSEVEYVIKTGRQIVEKKQVDHTDQLSAQIDAVKLLYNELGAQVCQLHPSCNGVMQPNLCRKRRWIPTNQPVTPATI